MSALIIRMLSTIERDGLAQLRRLSAEALRGAHVRDHDGSVVVLPRERARGGGVEVIVRREWRSMPVIALRLHARVRRVEVAVVVDRELGAVATGA